MTTAPQPGPSTPVPAHHEAALAELQRLLAATEGGRWRLLGLLDDEHVTERLDDGPARLDAVEAQVKGRQDGELEPGVRAK